MQFCVCNAIPPNTTQASPHWRKALHVSLV
ncbi:unnamed protein product [Staurois parvus]|uniref:Uncharacterized protein n=1 Tax=Staurois parvus TaxID=386267 RepID=A0ABN9D720_9NEOB|nr:unnamed protein product [Staurois parvus]